MQKADDARIVAVSKAMDVITVTIHNAAARGESRVIKYYDERKYNLHQIELIVRNLVDIGYAAKCEDTGFETVSAIISDGCGYKLTVEW